jgi:O-antigen ligase
MKLVFVFVIIVIVIFTRNRAAPVALFASFAIVLMFNNKFKLFMRLMFILIISIFLLSQVFPNYNDMLTLAFRGLFDVRGDETGNWRFLVQWSALTQALATPILGQGFGGYFQFYVPEYHAVIELPPHNIFIYLFSKSGIIGLLLGILLLISIITILIKSRDYWSRDSDHFHFYLLFQIIFISQFIYGMAYEFSFYFTLFAGFSLLINNELIKKFPRTIVEQ